VDRVVAVVGTTPILHSELLDELLMRRARGLEIPEDSAARVRVEREVLGEMVDAELLVQKAAAEKVEVTEEDLNRTIEQQMKEIRGRFASETEFRTELRRSGFGTPEDYRRRQLELLRRGELQREVVQKLRRDQKLAPSPVSEAELDEAYQQSKASVPKREAQIGFRQIVVAPKPTTVARQAARARAESLLVEIARGGDFEQIAKRESMDPGTKELGGDLGWNRRGKMLKEFDDMMFALPVGRVSPIVETAYGFHIIRVDRAQPAEVKARHILIRPVIDSADVARARLEADSVRAALEKGADFDSLSARHHDPVENASLPEFPRAELPGSYATAVGDAGVGALVGPFAIDDPANQTQKQVVLRVTMSTPAGEYPESEIKARLREQISEAKTIRKLIDNLKKGTYVTMRL
jgi:peptidyl-prolyl cis-trans isomerase SurA